MRSWTGFHTSIPYFLSLSAHIIRFHLILHSCQLISYESSDSSVSVSSYHTIHLIPQSLSAHIIRFMSVHWEVDVVERQFHCLLSRHSGKASVLQVLVVSGFMVYAWNLCWSHVMLCWCGRKWSRVESMCIVTLWGCTLLFCVTHSVSSVVFCSHPLAIRCGEPKWFGFFLCVVSFAAICRLSALSVATPWKKQCVIYCISLEIARIPPFWLLRASS